MNIIINESLVKRNARIGQAAMIAGLLTLAGGMYISFRYTDARYFYLSLLALLLGFILSQVGIFYANRFGKRPRPDQLLDQALKGLDVKYTLFHYMSPAAHLLIGPAGVWIFLPRSQRGRITYSNGRWKQSGGSLYLKIFAQEGLGRPDIDVAAERDRLKRLFQERIPDSPPPDIQAALVFTNPAVQINIPEDAETPAQTITIDKLKETVRKAAKSKSISPQTIQQLLEVLPSESR